MNAKSSVLLARLLFVAGHVAFRQLAHMEVIESELKRRRHNKKPEAVAKPGEVRKGVCTLGSYIDALCTEKQRCTAILCKRICTCVYVYVLPS